MAGRYRDKIDVIGDKSGGRNSFVYSQNPESFQQQYNKLQQTVAIPIRFIHCVRNPFDIISTEVLYRIKGTLHQKDFFHKLRKNTHYKQLGMQLYKKDKALTHFTRRQFTLADSVLKMSQSLVKKHSHNMLEVHNHELVSHPEDTILKLCRFLEIECSSDYVKSCASKVFPELSRTRFNVDWSEEAKKLVEERIRKYPFFRKYSYDSML